MTWELFGDLLLCIMILSAGIIFTIANINHIPEKQGDEDENR